MHPQPLHRRRPPKSSPSSSHTPPPPPSAAAATLPPPFASTSDHPHNPLRSSPSFPPTLGDGADNLAASAGNLNVAASSPAAAMELASWCSKQAKIWPAGCSGSGSSSSGGSATSCSEQELGMTNSSSTLRDSSALEKKKKSGAIDGRHEAFGAGDEGRHSAMAMALKRGSTHINGGTWRREGRSSSSAVLNRGGSRRGFQVIELQARPRIAASNRQRQAAEQALHLPHHHHLQSYLHDRRRRRRPYSAAIASHGALLQNPAAAASSSYSSKHHRLHHHHHHHTDFMRGDPALMAASTTGGGNCFCVPRRGGRALASLAAARRAGGRARYGCCNSERSFSPLDSDAETAPLMTEPEPYNEEEASDDGGQAKQCSSSMDVRDLAMAMARRKDGGGAKPGLSVMKMMQHQQQQRKKKEDDSAMASKRSLSQKYRPTALKEILGQPMVSESLHNAILRHKIAPVYLFQGPRGTGKTSAARIFISAMNCLSPEELLRPCGVCRECLAMANGHNYDFKEIDGASNRGLDSMLCLLKHISLPPSTSRYKVFLVDSCHSLSHEAWNALLQSLEDPPSYVVFILITSDPDLIPRTVASRCHKFIFLRIKDSDIAFRLRRLAAEEGVEIESEALHFIANRADGSLRDAENMLDQLSLMGSKVTLPMVQDMVGLIPDEKLSNLLILALSGDSSNTVHAIRDLIDSGFEPLSLTSQLASLITDILAGKKSRAAAASAAPPPSSSPSSSSSTSSSSSSIPELTLQEIEEERLKQALRILSESEKQLRSCTDRTTWLTAAFLQFTTLNSDPCLSRDTSLPRTSSPAIFNVNTRNQRDTPNHHPHPHPHPHPHQASAAPTTTDGRCSAPKSPSIPQPAEAHKQPNTLLSLGHTTDCKSPVSGKHSAMVTKSGAVVGLGNIAQRAGSRVMSPSTMKNIWSDVVQSVCLDAVKQLLLEQGRLISLSLTEASAIARIAFCHPQHKSMAEEAKGSIANAFQLVLGFPTEVEIRFDQMHRESHQIHADGMGKSSQFDEFGCRGVVGPVDDSNYGSGLEDLDDRGGSNMLCCYNAPKRSKGKHARRRRRGRFLLRLVPCAKGGRVT